MSSPSTPTDLQAMSDFIQFAGPGLLGIAFISGIILGDTARSCVWRRAAIKRGFAEYDAKTGEWKWKEPMT